MESLQTFTTSPNTPHLTCEFDSLMRTIPLPRKHRMPLSIQPLGDHGLMYPHAALAILQPEGHLPGHEREHASAPDLAKWKPCCNARVRSRDRKKVRPRRSRCLKKAVMAFLSCTTRHKREKIFAPFRCGAILASCTSPTHHQQKDFENVCEAR